MAQKKLRYKSVQTEKEKKKKRIKAQQKDSTIYMQMKTGIYYIQKFLNLSF